MKYRKKPVVIEAFQWLKHGDHPKVIKKYKDDDVRGTALCKCNWRMYDHGIINTLEGVHIVCPGDWIITGVKGEQYPCKPDIFDMTYDKVE